MYDYGKKSNKLIYGSPIPPTYDVSKIKVPTYIMASMADWATDRKVIEVLKTYYFKTKFLFCRTQGICSER